MDDHNQEREQPDKKRPRLDYCQTELLKEPMNSQTRTTLTCRNDTHIHDLENMYSTIESKTRQAVHNDSDNTGETYDALLKNQIQPVEYVKQATPKSREEQATLSVDTNEKDQTLLEVPKQLRDATIHHKDTQVTDEQTQGQTDTIVYRKYNGDITMDHLIPGQGKILLCEQCLSHSIVSKNTATHLCFDCEYYLCFNCSRNCLMHNLVSSSDKKDQQIEFDKMHRNLECNAFEKFKEERLNLSQIINIKCNKDTIFSNINGIAVLQNGNLGVISDHDNQCIKIINMHSSKVIRRIQFESEPWGVSEIPSTGFLPGNIPEATLIAVTFPFQKEFIVINIDSRPASIVIAHKMFDACYDIVVHRDQYVTLCERKDRDTLSYLAFLHKSGLTLKIIKLYTNPDRPLSLENMYFCLHPDLDIIYVSSLIDRSVMSFNYEGQVLNKYKCSYIEHPCGICIGKDNYVYTSLYSKLNDNSRICRMSLELSDHKLFVIPAWGRADALTSLGDKVYFKLVSLEAGNMLGVLHID